MSELREYIVTLYNFDDAQDFYDDMETPGGSLYIPDRAIDVVNRRPSSRNTHYLLSDEEAEQVSNDPRVESVELTPDDRGLIISPAAITYSTSSWNKSASVIESNHKNWGLLRCFEGVNRTDWGSAISTSTYPWFPPATNAHDAETGSIKLKNTGKNVDVVIIDGHVNPNHPEFSVNPDGTGGSRVIQYNWLQHNPAVLGTSSGTYVYNYYLGASGDNNHGAHVAGTVAGNTQGWARSANIYNISPYATNPNSGVPLSVFEYVRQFHINKPINPLTGRKNPTICTNSWVFLEASTPNPPSLVKSVTYRGITYTGTFTNSVYSLYGIPQGAQGGARVASVDADIADCIASGVIVVAAAGNNTMYIDVENGVDYNNNYIRNDSTTTVRYYHRGPTPAGAPNVIAVGAASNYTTDTKASYSAYGPKVDLYAPGNAIMSSVNDPYSFNSRPSLTVQNSCTYTLGTVTKTAGSTSGWNAGAYSPTTYSSSSFCYFKVTPSTSTLVAAGLSTSAGSNTDPNSINFGFRLSSSTWTVIENGVDLNTGTYTSANAFIIVHDRNKVRYFYSGTLVRSVTTSVGAVAFDCALHNPGNTINDIYFSKTYSDPRNIDTYLSKIQGTSMATPQVTGVLTCVLEQYPNFNQYDCRNYLAAYSKKNQIISSSTSSYTDVFDVKTTSTRYLYYVNERKDSGGTHPKVNYRPRENSGVVYPRTKIRK